MLGLPDDITALLFDLDGVLTQTAKVHYKAWKQTFDDYLKSRDGADFTPFTQDDYNEYVDGMPRYDGVRSFLKSRDIELPEGSPDDGPDKETVGYVTAVADGVARVEGLPSVMASELLEFPGGLIGVALNIDEQDLGVVLLGESSHIQEGDPVKPEQPKDQRS